MKKILVLALAVSLFSCKKEDLADNKDNQPPTPSTITVDYSDIFNQLYYCRFTYYDVDGIYHLNQNETDKTVENVDFSRPFKVEAQCGVSMYNPANGQWIQNPQSTAWQTKKDGVVVDTDTAVEYVYQN